MPKKRFTAAERQAYLLAYDTSGQSPTAFATTHKINRTTLTTWLSRRNKNGVRLKARNASHSKGFVEVAPRRDPANSQTNPSPIPSKEHFRISIGRMVIECDGLPDPRWLVALAQVL